METTFNREVAVMLESASRSALLSGPLTLIQSDVLAGNLKILRSGSALKLTPHFEEWFERTFRALAAAVLKSLQLFGIAAIVLAPPARAKPRRRGVRALQRGDAQLRHNPDAMGAAAASVGTPVCLSLTSDTVELTWETYNGIREYSLKSDNFDEHILENVLVSVLEPPNDQGYPTTAVAGVLTEVSMQSAFETVALDVALENARPLQLVQRRHGPSGSAIVGGGATGVNLFFDSESQQIVDDNKEKESKTLIDQVRELNRLQTTAQEPLKVGTIAKETDPPRIFQLHPDLETATHATAASGPSLTELATLRASIFESVSLAVGAPAGLIRGSTAHSTGDLQQQLFAHRCDALRGEIENVLTATYHSMFGSYDDSVIFEKDSEPCKDAELISRLFQSGVLEGETARSLVAGILQVERCGVHERETRDGEHNGGGGGGRHLALRSPAPSNAPSEVGDKD
jgi:hypothetical protein